MWGRLAKAGPVQRRYLRRMALSSVFYVAAIFAASRLLDREAPVSALGVVIALMPGVAVLGMIGALARLYLELGDEYLRMLEVRKAMVATGLTLAVCSVWGILELFTPVPRLPLFWVFPMWALGLGLGALVNKLTLGDAGCA